MISDGQDRAVQSYNRTVEKGQIAYVDRGRHLISADTKRMSDWIASWRQRVLNNWDETKPTEREVFEALSKCEVMGEVRSLDSPVLALCVVDYIYRRLGRTYAKPQKAFLFQTSLGTRVQEELVYQTFKEDYRDTWKSSQRFVTKSAAYIRKDAARKAFLAEGKNVRLWSPQTRSLIGGWLMEAFRLATGHLEFKNQKGPKGYDSMVRLPRDVWDYVSRSTDDDIHYRPRLTPVIDPPRDWTSFNNGGFQLDQLQTPVVLMDEFKNDVSIDFFLDKEMGEVLDGINALQKTRWGISSLAAEVFDHYTDKNINRAGLVFNEARELTRYWKNMTPEERKTVRIDRAKTIDLNRREHSVRSSYPKIKLSRGRVQDHPFYFVCRADSRGRVYYASEYFNPQAGDHVRGQLNFFDGYELDETGLRWLKIEGANLAGQDKLSFSDRVQWVEDNIDLIAGVAEDPYRNQEWEEMDSPFQFLAWADDFVRAVGGGKSHAPVAMDGSNNGLQLFSLILRDPVLAESTNCVPVDRPNDVYQAVADAVWEAMDGVADRIDDPDGAMARFWLKFFDQHYGGRVPRVLTKRPVMTKAYSVTRFTVMGYISDWIHENHYTDIRKEDRPKRVQYLAKVLWQQMERMLSGASKGMDWLKACAKQVVKETGEVPYWTSPSGFPVFQPYYRHNMEKVELVFGQRTNIRRVRGGPRKDAVRSRKVVNAVAPNFIHGVDGAIAHRLAVRMQEKIPGVALRFVHDSFATHAAHASVLAETIREVVYEVTRDDLLGRLKDEWEARYGIELPETPEYGDLDLRKVLEAEYAYS